MTTFRKLPITRPSTNTEPVNNTGLVAYRSATSENMRSVLCAPRGRPR